MLITQLPHILRSYNMLWLLRWGTETTNGAARPLRLGASVNPNPVIANRPDDIEDFPVVIHQEQIEWFDVHWL